MRMAQIRIEVACALPTRQCVVELAVEQGATAVHALHQSGILDRFPEIASDTVKLGIHGRILAPDTPLREGDRVEIYRPLTVDPKSTRRSRAARARRN